MSSDGPVGGADISTLGHDTLSVTEDAEGGQTTFFEGSGFDGTTKLDPDTRLAGDMEVRDVWPEGDDDRRVVGTVGEAVDAWRDYLTAREDDVIVLRKLDEAKDEGEKEQVLTMPYQHRWKQHYRRKTYAKLKAVEEAVEAQYGENVPTTMVSLTGYQYEDADGWPCQSWEEDARPRPPLKVMEEMKDAWGDFRKVLDKILQPFDTEYVKVWEPHKSGYPHLHVAIFGVSLPSLQQTVEDLWVDHYGVGGEKAHEDAVETRRGRSARLENPASYLMKYVGRGLIRDSENVRAGESVEEAVDARMPSTAGYQVFSAMLWISGIRQYSMSQGLSEAISVEKVDGDDAEWEFIGICSGLDTGMYEGRAAEQLLEHLEGSHYIPAPDLDPTEQASLGEPPPSVPAD